MSMEIERKFLVKCSWKPCVAGVRMKQGYIATGNNNQARLSVRVRVAGQEAFLNLKSKVSAMERLEYEYAVPIQEAEDLLNNFAPNLVEKTRYTEMHNGKVWEIDVFHGANEGLSVAEVELDSCDENIVLPIWVGQEVTEDERYLNTYLAAHPYTKW